jgi:hypothetical protein
MREGMVNNVSFFSIKQTNGGECVDLVDGFKCICPLGYTGSQCQVSSLNEFENSCTPIRLVFLFSFGAFAFASAHKWPPQLTDERRNGE